MGAGRTEVARAVFGADPVDAGEIRVHGKPVTIRTPADAVKHGIGYLSEDRKHFGRGRDGRAEQHRAVEHRRFVRRGVFLDARALRDTAQSRAAARDPHAVGRAAGAAAVGRQPAEDRDREVAAARLRHPVLRRADARHRRRRESEIYKLLDALAADGKAIVMISSELPEVLRMSHRILVMCEGRVTGELRAADATQEKIMQLATQRESTVLS